MIIEDYVLGLFIPSMLAGIMIGLAIMFAKDSYYTSSILSLVGVLVSLATTYVTGVKLIKFHDTLIEHYATTTYSERRGMR